jgi:hypothetical protein
MVDAVQGSPEHYKGQFGSLKFPPYKYHEYPKVLYRDEERKKVLGTAQNAMEEKELYASIGVDKVDIDPLGAALDEVSVLRAKLAQYEGQGEGQIAAQKTAAVRTSTVEMLPESAPPNAPVAGKAPNPLLKVAAQPAGSPQPVGSAPKMDKILNPGV